MTTLVPQTFRNQAVRMIAFALLVLVWSNHVAQAGEKISPERGFNPGNSYAFSDIETISTQSGNLMLNIPVGALPAGRGGMSAALALHYNSKLWDVDPATVTVGDPSLESLDASAEGGWHYGYDYELKMSGEGCDNQGYANKLQIALPDGSQHLLWLEGHTDDKGNINLNFDGSQACPNNPYPTLSLPVTYFTVDGSFLRVEVVQATGNSISQWILYYPDGKRVEFNRYTDNGFPVKQRVFDRNGNYVDFIEKASDPAYSNRRTTTIKDQLNRKIVIEYEHAANEDWVRSSGFQNAELITKVQWKTITVRSTFDACWNNCLPGTDHQTTSTAFRVVDKIYPPSPQPLSPPDSGSLYYQFNYNADAASNPSLGWGEVNYVRLPSGAFAAYEYLLDRPPGTTGQYPRARQVANNRPKKKTLKHTEQYDGASSARAEIWQYNISGSASTGDASSASIVAPNGATTSEYFGSWKSSQTGYPQARVLLKSVGANGTTVEKVYQANIPTDAALLNAANHFVKAEFTTLTDYAGNPTKTAITEYSRDKNGNVTEVKEYDFVAYSAVARENGRPTGAIPATAQLKKVALTSYYNEAPDSASTDYADADGYHLASNPRLLGLAKATEIRNAAGAAQARSEISYDYTNYTTNTKAGNPVVTKSWDSVKAATLPAADSVGFKLTANNSISTSATYDAFGNPLTSIDARGTETVLTYGDISTGSGSSTVNNLYPTKTEIKSNNTVLQTADTKYDYSTGLVTETKSHGNAPSEFVTNQTDYDQLGRPVTAKAAVGTNQEIWTQTEYYDAEKYVVTKADLFTKGDGLKVSIQHFDELGRVRLARTLENAASESAANEQHGIKVQTRYLPSGTCTYSASKTCSFQLTSNPYRAATSSAAASDPTMGWTLSQTENTGKHSEVETFSGAALPAPFTASSPNPNSTGAVKTDTDAERTLVTDQAGKKRISETNAFGQLINVWEVTAADDNTVSVSFGDQTLAAYKTGYTYDTLGNLTNVTQNLAQGGQSRSFAYSSLSRLKSAMNPESGTIHYTYDNGGNLKTKSDARGIKTVYDYDQLNRLTTRCYIKPNAQPGATTCAGVSSTDLEPNSPTAYYVYDDPTVAFSKGKLTKVYNSHSETKYLAFDPLGRVLSSRQITGATAPDPMTYTYNLSGALVEQKYPSGRVVKNTINSDGSLKTVESKKNQSAGYWTYAQRFTYTAAGAVSSMQFGNGTWESTAFNSRLQPTQIALGKTQNAVDLLKLNYTYQTPNLADNNGNVKTQIITVPESAPAQANGFTATQTYNYDALNRLKDATETMTGTGQTWKQTYKYDRFGNREFVEANTSTLPKDCTDSNSQPAVCPAIVPIVNPAPNTSDNRLQNYEYDAAGNMKTDAGNLTADPNKRRYTYDGENKQTKVERLDATGTNVIGTIGEYFYDADGHRVKKKDVGTGETTIFVYDALGKMVAEYSTDVATASNAKVGYLTNDTLGSPRIITDKNGNVTTRRDFLPFGEEIGVNTPQTAGRNTNTQYTGDNVRKKFATYERDTEAELDFAQARYYNFKHGRFTSVDPLMASADIINPQTFHRYAYVGNNPVNITDPTGEDWGVNRSTGEVKWFDGALGAGFSAYDLLYAFVADKNGKATNQMVALNAATGAALPVADAAAWLAKQVAWGAGSGALAASAAALAGVPVAVAATALSDVLDPAGRWRTGMNLPEPVRDWAGTKQSYWDEFLNKLSKAKGNESSPTSANMQGQTSPANPDPENNRPFGSRGTQTASTTVWQRGQYRIDVENPNPGQRAGQIHFQDQATRAKYLYNPQTNTFINAPRSVNQMLQEKRVQRAIDKAFRILGEERP